MENDPKDFLRVHAIATGQLTTSNEDGPITLPLLDCWVAPAFGDGTSRSHQKDARQIRLVLDRQLLGNIAQWIQDLSVEPQSQLPQPPWTAQ